MAHDCADLIDREAATVWGRWPPGAHEADRDTRDHAVSVASRRGEVKTLRRRRDFSHEVRLSRFGHSGGQPVVWCGSAYVVRQRRAPGHLPKNEYSRCRERALGASGRGAVTASGGADEVLSSH
jgi:hypothetical protein